MCHSSVKSNNVHHRRLWHANWLLMKVLSLCNPLCLLFSPLSHIKKLSVVAETVGCLSELPFCLFFFILSHVFRSVCSFNQQKTWHKKSHWRFIFPHAFLFQGYLCPSTSHQWNNKDNLKIEKNKYKCFQVIQNKYHYFCGHLLLCSAA